MAIANPYANLQLRIPEREWEAVRRFTTTFRPEDGSAPDIDRSPFSRYVDLWWAGLILGVREDRRSRSRGKGLLDHAHRLRAQTASHS